MDLRAISAVLLKVAGLILIALAVARAPSLFAYAARESWSATQVLFSAAFGVGPQVVIGALFWFFPGTITNKVVADSSPTTPFEFGQLQLVALVVVGTYLVAHSLTEVAHIAASTIVFSRENPDVSLTPLVPRAVAAAAELVIGIGICLGRRGIGAMVDRMRGQ